MSDKHGHDAVRAAFRRQAEACTALGSPFTARLSALHAERLIPGTPVADHILGWQGDPSPSADSVPLRIAGCLHGLVLEGRDAGLSAAYPPHDIDDGALWAEVTRAETAHADFILERLKSAPQTSEVRRSGVLLPGFLTLGRLFDKPLVLSEVGASAGLNLLWDKYAIDLGGTTYGPSASPVRINPEWRGKPAPSAIVTVADRAACDLNPVLAADPASRLRMLSYIWADQADRLVRTAAALDIAAEQTLAVEKADAIDWLEKQLAEPRSGIVHVVYHTIAWQYFPKALQEKGEAILASAGARASAEAPLARLALEADDQPNGASLTLQIWPSGEKKQIGRGDFHGRWVDWWGW